MFGSKKTPLREAKPSSVGPVHSPFDSDKESKDKKYNSSKKTLTNTNPFDDDVEVSGHSSSSSYGLSSAHRNRYKNDFRDSGGLESQSVQELEDYAVYKAEETTKSVNSCLKIAEEMREDATKTLVMLHQQGEQITRSHHVAADIDHDLSRVLILLFSQSQLLHLLKEIFAASIGILHYSFDCFVDVFPGRKTFGKSWWHVFQNMETQKDGCDNWPSCFWRLVFSLLSSF